MNARAGEPAPRATHPIDTQGDFELATWQSYIKGLRNFWRTEAYQAVVHAADSSLAPRDIERQCADLPAYRLYAWLERHSQQMKYYGRRGLVDLAAQRAGACRALVEQARAADPRGIALPADFRVPQYVRDSHTHQHVGGVWAHPESAFAYEASTSGFSFALGDAASPMKVYAQAAIDLAASAGVQVRKVIDVGCATGGSTQALHGAFPRAQVLGVDVCAPAVQLAHLRSRERGESGEQVAFAQRAAEDLGVAAGSIDLVASHWLYHEMPVAAIRAALKEAFRALGPGGLFLAFDMYLVPGGNVGAWLHEGYARRNNEPFAAGFSAMDLRAELARVGFTGIDIRLAPPQPPATRNGMPDTRTHAMTLVTCRKPA